MSDDRRSAVRRKLDEFPRLCEVGIGDRDEVAAGLASDGRAVTATDVVEREPPAGVTFVRDDVVAAADRVAGDDDADDPDNLGDADPDSFGDGDLDALDDAYRVDCVYALNCPPELHRPLLRVAGAVDAACAFTTLGGDPPAVEATPLALSGGDTLYVARDPDDVLID
ncbi:hypothetical protein Hbl1158_03815 [Halobaculum sp. CBA1158]|uniref:UPF0146 family protein n=1 Tax=Halobaculum sp. CBA1158 TaxID=2904243 RepID=UPI001F30A8C2|nr:UPF0146 family protein [Halobaculum sp. CBA1158]UIP00499.1 hypothetical protein Hbl1158_03815 [Halobaculum sp. CBA1158]